MSAYGRKPKRCETCGKTILVPKALMRRKRFCSRQCLGVENVARLNRIRRSPKEYARPPIRHGAANNKFVPALVFVCEQCRRPFERKPWRTRQRGFVGRFCGAACRGEYRRLHQSGPDSPFWVGGIQTYRGRDWQRMRLIVVAEQQGRCARCGRNVGNSLPVNHVRPFREFASPDEANRRENLIGLCQSCHMKTEPRRRTSQPAPTACVPSTGSPS